MLCYWDVNTKTYYNNNSQNGGIIYRYSLLTRRDVISYFNV